MLQRKEPSKSLKIFVVFLEGVELSSIVATVSILILSLFTFLYNLREAIDTSMVIGCSFFVGLIIMMGLSFVIVIKQRSKNERSMSETAIKCYECGMNFEKEIFQAYGLLTFEAIIALEEELAERPDARKCIVYNFTTLDDTVEGTIRDIITNNIKHGVKYKVFYTDEDFGSNHRNIELYGQNNIFYQSGESFINVSSFDILLHSTPTGDMGYAAVNFSLANSDHDTCMYSSKCTHDETSILYKKLSSGITHDIRKQLDTLGKDSQKEEKCNE